MPCTDGDAEYIWEKDKEVFDSIMPSDDGAEEELLVFKAVDHIGRVVGGCILDIDLLKTAEFNCLWVDEPYRRQGIGSALIRKAEQAAAEKGCRLIVNAYTFDFQSAKSLFEKNGYTLAGITENWPEGHENYTLMKMPVIQKKECIESDHYGTDGYSIIPGSDEDAQVLTSSLEEYNRSFAPRAHGYITLDKKIVYEEGRIIGGCIAGVSGWDALHVDLIWIDGAYSSQKIDSLLLDELEKEAKETGAYISLVSIAEPQAELFRKHGYTVSVVYENEPKWYVMQKPF